MDEVRIVYYYRKLKVPALRIFFRKVGFESYGKQGVSGYTAHNIHISPRCLLLFGGLIKLYLHITSGDVSNLIALYQQNTF